MMMKFSLQHFFLLHPRGQGKRIILCLFMAISFLILGMMINKTIIGTLTPFNTSLSIKTTTMLSDEDTTTIIEITTSSSSFVQDDQVEASPKILRINKNEEEQEKETLKLLNSETISSSTSFTNFLIHSKIWKLIFVTAGDGRISDDDDDDGDDDVKSFYQLPSLLWGDEKDRQDNPRATTQYDIDKIDKDQIDKDPPKIVVHSVLPSENIEDGQENHHPKGSFGSLLLQWIQKEMKLSNMKIYSSGLILIQKEIGKDNVLDDGGGGDSDSKLFKMVGSKYNKEDNNYYKEEEEEEEEEEEDSDNKSGGGYLRVSSNLGQGPTIPSKDNRDQDVYDIITSSLHKKPRMSFMAQDIEIKPNRLLQTSGASPICSNISDTFTTTYVIIYAGNQSLVTDEKANILAITFATSYNNERIGTNGGNTIGNKCDPLFRTITQVQVTTNASFTGASNGEVVENPLPMIPVRKLQQQHLEGGGEQSSSSALMDGISWESSILEFHEVDSHNKDWIHRQLQLQQQQQQQSQSNNNNTFSNNTFRPPQTGNFGFGLLLLDIIGTCRGCQGSGSVGISLFDDITTTTSTRARQLEEDMNNSTNSTDCVCPADAALADSNSFQEAFQSQIEELRDNGEIDFVEQINEVVPVRGTKCPTKDQDFSTVYLVTGMVFSRTLLLRLGVKGVQEVETYFRDSYNGVAQQLCDPLYRAISNNQLVSIIETEDGEEEEGSTRTVQLEFVIQATCRGDNCIDSGCIFDEANSCDSQENRRRAERTLHAISNIDHVTQDNDDAIFLPADESMIGITDIRRPSRFLQKDDKKNDDDKEERCFCRKGRSIRPPTEHEFKMAFQAGLDQITEKNKLSSCLECSFPTDCKSGVCLEGRCAEADTGLLLNSCGCSNSAECESGFCQRDDGLGTYDLPVSGICQGKLPSCRACNNGDECLSGFCTEDRCAEASDGKLKTGCACTSNVNCQTGRCVDDVVATGVLGECTEKINNTCTEPCFSPNDCASGLCGSVVCMPLDGTLLPDGCFSTMSSECESGMSENNRCTTAATSHPPSFQPSPQSNTPDPTIATTPGPTFEPSPQPSTQPSVPPSLSPSAGPTMSPSTFPSEAPTMSPSTFPSVTPTMLPSTFPSDAPSTPVPSMSPSLSPSTSPSTSSPSTPPSSTPSTSFPSKSPTSSPTQSPSASPSASPSVLADCRTFLAGNYKMSLVHSFCKAHGDDDECCSGEEACGGWNPDSTYTICKNSCRGNKACFGIAQNSIGAAVEIGTGSCREDNSCESIASESDDGAIVKIGDASCKNNDACKGVGHRATLVSIGVEGVDAPGQGACRGPFSCNGIKEESNTEGGAIIIQNNACVENNACGQLGLSSEGDIMINSNSCYGQAACNLLGSKVSGNIIVNSDSCRGQLACSNFGTVASSISVGPSSCTFFDPNSNGSICRNFGNEVSGFIVVRPNSCTGYQACLNFATKASSIVMGESACRGYQSCESCGSSFFFVTNCAVVQNGISCPIFSSSLCLR